MVATANNLKKDVLAYLFVVFIGKVGDYYSIENEGDYIIFKTFSI